MQLLLIEDDRDLGAAVVAHLEADGHRVAWCTSLAAAEDIAPPQLALLDLKLPDGDGLDLLRRWRQQGAPWPVLARIRAVARRAGGPGADAGSWHIDEATHQAWRGDQRVDLTRMEWAVLACLAGHRGRIYSRSEIESRLQHEGLAEGISNSLEVVISRLRRKLGAASISTHRGLGYRLE